MKPNTTFVALVYVLAAGVGVTSGAASLPTTTVIVVTGDRAPDGNGSFSAFRDPALNDAGQAAFEGFLTGTSLGGADDSGVFRGDGVSGPVQIARERQAAPDGNGIFLFVGRPALNEAGQAAFLAGLFFTSGGSSDNNGLFRGDGVSDLVQIVRKGQAAPDGNGSFDVFGSPALNDAGQAAFRATLTGTSIESSGNIGIFRGDGVSGPVKIARVGQAAPDGIGSFSNFNFPALNDAGQAAFRATLTGTSGGSSGNIGIFRGDGVSGPVKIARAGQTAPDANGAFSDFRSPALNDAGQAAFWGSFANTSGGDRDDAGIFFFDDAVGLRQVAREGDALLGSTITRLEFDNGFAHFGDERSGLNEVGQVAYQFTLADDRRGIAIWTIPEPASLMLFALSAMTLKICRRENA